MTEAQKMMKAIETFIDAKIGFAKAHPIDRVWLGPMLDSKRDALHDALAKAMAGGV